jgi:hypothetical protein
MGRPSRNERAFGAVRVTGILSDRTPIEDVEPYLGQKRDRLQRAQPDQPLVVVVERQGVEDAIELAGVHGVELRVAEELPKTSRGSPVRSMNRSSAGR